MPFWPEPISVFGSSMLTMPMAVHICWTYHSARPSHRLDAGSVRKPLAGFPLSNRQRALVSAALDPAVTSYADADRLLRTEPQVQLHESSRVEQSFKRLQVAPGPHPASSPAPARRLRGRDVPPLATSPLRRFARRGLSRLLLNSLIGRGLLSAQLPSRQQTGNQMTRCAFMRSNLTLPSSMSALA